MSNTLTVTTGFDTWTVQPAPGRVNAGRATPGCRNGSGTDRHVALWVPLSGIAGRVILSATLSGRVTADEASSHTAVVRPYAAAWDVNTLSWSNQPGVRGPTFASVSPGPLSAGERIEWDMTALVQEVANGEANYGWRITNDLDEYLTFWGFNSGEDAWTLTVEVSDVLIAPSDLSPAGVVSVGAWVCQADEVEDLAAVHVQVGAAADGVAPGFDSGEIASTLPELDLADTDYTGLADEATTFWRMRLKNSDASWSEWSDWVEVTRHVKPTFTVTSPAAGLLLDPSPSIEAEVATGIIEKWRIRITESGNRANVLYDSGDINAMEDATSVSKQVPLRKRGTKGPLVFPVDGDYDLLVRAWDRHDRVSSPGDPSYMGGWQTVTMDVDGAEVPPSTLTAVPVGDGRPGVVLTWTRPAEADAFVVLRDGDVIARVDEADVQVGTNAWSYTDDLAHPNHEQTYVVRAVTDGKQSAGSPAAVSHNPVEGVWIRSRFGDVVLAGTDVDDMQLTEKRQTIVLPFAPADVDVVTAIGGYQGTYSGVLHSLYSDVWEARRILRRLRHSPHEEVTLVWGTVAIPAQLRGLTWGPHSELLPDNGVGGPVNDLHTVSFGFQQVDDFAADGMP